jgi:dihydroxyacetone kinase
LGSDQDLSKSGIVDLVFIFRRIASVVEQSMGGTSGAIYAIFFNAVSGSLKEQTSSNAVGSDLPKIIAKALQYGLTELCRYTGAREGHRTLMDALIPFVGTFATDTDLIAAVKAATVGAEKTRKMEASFGRASYVAKEQFEKEGGIPDPGALGVVSVVKGVLAGLQGHERS